MGTFWDSRFVTIDELERPIAKTGGLGEEEEGEGREGVRESKRISKEWESPMKAASERT